MEMTKNEAYLYAKKKLRGVTTNKQLETKMRNEGYTENDIALVKEWRSHKRVGI